MIRVLVVVFACAVLLPSEVRSQTPALEAAGRTMGTANLRTLQFTATGLAYLLGQPPSAGEGWPIRLIKTYKVSLDYAGDSMRVEQVLTMPIPDPRGGGVSFNGDQRQVQMSKGTVAWNETAPAAGSQTTGVQPQPGAAAERLIWRLAVTPQGLLKGVGSDARVQASGGGTQVTFTAGGRRVVAFINKANEIERAQWTLPNDVLGDMDVITTYAGYREIGGLLFPTRIRQTQGGFPTLDLTISTVQTNAALDVSVPEQARGTPAAPSATSQKVADGLFWITGGSHHSLAADMGDHIVVIEGPQNEARSEVVIAEVKKLIPNKPIRFVVNTHVHFDHSGGLRTYVAEGATVVTHQANTAYYEKAWAASRTLAPDRLSKSGRKPVFQGVSDRFELKGTNDRVIELHLLRDNPHNDHLLVAWLPAEKVLFQSDMMTAPAPNAAVPPPSPMVLNFAENLARLNIDPEQVICGHGPRIATRAELQAITGKTGTH